MRSIHYLPDCDPQRLLTMTRRDTHGTSELAQFRLAVIAAGALWLLIVATFAIGAV